MWSVSVILVVLGFPVPVVWTVYPYRVDSRTWRTRERNFVRQVGLTNPDRPRIERRSEELFLVRYSLTGLLPVPLWADRRDLVFMCLFSDRFSLGRSAWVSMRVRIKFLILVTVMAPVRRRIFSNPSRFFVPHL